MAWRATDSSSPAPAMPNTSDDPPALTNGSGTPVMGRMPITAPMLTNACMQNQAVTPIASSRPNRSGACRAMRTPMMPSSTNSPTTTIDPTRPSSSPMMAKMKSEWA